MNLKDILMSRLLKKRVITSGGCWVMLTPSGMAKKELYVINRNQPIHRVSAFVYLDFDLSSNALICHKCKTKFCWNPNHIYIGNTSSNTLDSVRDGTFRNPNVGKEICKKGHALYGNNLYMWKDRDGRNHRWCKICRLEATIRNRQKRSL